MDMRTYDTLVVVASNRGGDTCRDLLACLRWGMAGSWHLVLVDDVGTAGTAFDAGDDHTVIRSALIPGKMRSGFKNNEGAAFALARGDRFEAVLCLDDDSLLVGRGLDEWALARIADDRADLIGVADRVSYLGEWPRWRPFFLKALPASSLFVPTAETIFYPICWMSRRLVERAAACGLLVPSHYQEWDAWPDVYVSWLCQLLGGYQMAVGHMDRPSPPIYAEHPNSMERAPQPWILHPDFKAYHSIRAVPCYAEHEVRAYYRHKRAAGA
jgi:hypothetical protein